ncbi:hypothetical protein YPPY103_1118, partial [Yersinia pestis PY-103]
MQYKTNSKVV